MTIHWKAVEQYSFVILEHLSMLELALSGVKGLTKVDMRRIMNSLYSFVWFDRPDESGLENDYCW